MINIIEKLYLDNKENVRNEDGVVIPETVTTDGIVIRISGINYTLGLVKLLLWYRPKYPNYVIDKIKVMFIDGDVSNTKINNMVYCFETPVESKTRPGFYYIPYHSKYLLSKDGILYNINRNTEHKNTLWTPPAINKKNIIGGYLVTRLKPDRGVSRSIGLHRLLGLTFLKYPAGVAKLVINHKDGDASNNDIANLEFVTRAINNQHAIDTGLCPNSLTSVTVKNVVTKEIFTFDSIAACGRNLGIPANTIRNRVSKPLKVYADNCMYRVNTGISWDDITPPTESSFIQRKILAIDVAAGNTIIADSIMGMRRIVGVNETSIADSCKNLRDTPIRGYLFRYYNSQTPNTIVDT